MENSNFYVNLDFLQIRRFQSIRGIVHANLAVAMIISTCIFLAGIEKNNDRVKSISKWLYYCQI